MMTTYYAGSGIEAIMNTGLLWIALLVAFADWIAVGFKIKVLEYIAKPGVMVVLLTWLWITTGFSGPLIWFALALLFSLGGDVFLMLPREQFIAGLISFLIGHLAYLVGFNTSPPPINAAVLAIAAAVLFAAARVYRAIAAGLQASGQTKLKPAVLAYSFVISLMLLSALLTLLRPAWDIGPASLVSFGAILFFLSDTILAWNKFVTPLQYGRLTTMVTYHSGQALIVIGAALQFSLAG